MTGSDTMRKTLYFAICVVAVLFVYTYANAADKARVRDHRTSSTSATVMRDHRSTVSSNARAGRSSTTVHVTRPAAAAAAPDIEDIMHKDTVTTLKIEQGLVAVLGGRFRFHGNIKRPKKVNTVDLIILADELIVDRNATIDVSGDPMRKSVTRRTFKFPFYPIDQKIRKLDWCYRLGEQCGQVAANAYCKARGYETAQSFSKANAGTLTFTQTIGDNRVCVQNCGIFSAIGCQGMRKRPGHGGDISIYANTINCEGGRLALIADGGKDGSKFLGPPGRIIISAENFPNGSHCIQTSLKGSGRERKVEKFESMRHIIEVEKQNVGDNILSEWVLARLEDLSAEIAEAGLVGDLDRLLIAFEDVERLADSNRFPIVHTHRDARTKAIEGFRRLRHEVLPAVWEQSFQLSIPGQSLSQTYMVLFNKANGVSQVAPTDLLIKPFRHNNKNVLGFMEFDPNSPERLMLSSMSVSMSADPWVTHLLDQEFKKQNRALKGVFSDWDLEVVSPDIQGIRNIVIDQTTGQSLNVSIELDTARAAVALQRLTREGIPITLQWTSRKDSQIGGKIGPLFLSLGRQSHSAIVIEEGIMRNVSDSLTQSAVYAFNAKTEYRLLEEETLSPGESATTGPHGDWEVPAEATYTFVDPTSLHEHFAQVSTDSIVQMISLVNNLASDPDRGGTLLYVELVVEYDSGNGTQKSDVIKLAPRGAVGSEHKLSFLRGPNTPIVSIEGVARYELGSQSTIPRQNVADDVIHITEDSFLK